MFMDYFFNNLYLNNSEIFKIRHQCFDFVKNSKIRLRSYC
jgi:hypothetical protein